MTSAAPQPISEAALSSLKSSTIHHCWHLQYCQKDYGRADTHAGSGVQELQQTRGTEV